MNPEVASGAAFDLYYLKNGLSYNEGKATADEVGVKALDDQTLEVTLENSYYVFLKFTLCYFLLPCEKGCCLKVKRVGRNHQKLTYQLALLL